MYVFSPPDFDVQLFADDILDVEVYGCIVGRSFDTFEDVDDDTAETVGVEVDFLVVGDLSDLAEMFVSKVPSGKSAEV